MASIMNPILNHLWQSSLFAVVVAMAVLALRHNHARTRYWLWLAASLKFLIPFSMLVAIGGRVEFPVVPATVPAMAVEQITTTFAPAPIVYQVARTNYWPLALCSVWLAGTVMLLIHWFLQWLLLRKAAKSSTPWSMSLPLPVSSSSQAIEPGVFGIFRPVLLLPEGIAERLNAEEFEAVLSHELCHARNYDNFTAALHMLVTSIFWFHPIVWWIGKKLVEERERACDQAVLRQGLRPGVYAQGILNVCKFYVESPLACAAGVTGADLKMRILEIMTQRTAHRMTLSRKLLLTAAGLSVISAPLVIGVLRAQTLPPAPKYGYEVVSVHKSNSGEQGSRISPGPQGGLKATNLPILELLKFAYDMRGYQFSGIPGWVQSDRYDIMFTPDKPEEPVTPASGRDKVEGLMNRNRERTRAVLRDRFGLVLRAETKELPIYGLSIAKNGSKLIASKEGRPNMRSSQNQLTGQGVYLDMLIRSLSSILGRPVVNETGLDGPYDFKLEWTPEGSEASGPSIFTALTEQLGLRLESKKGPVQVFVIEKIEKPSEN